MTAAAILKFIFGVNCRHISTKLSELVHSGTRINTSSFGFKSSKLKVTVGPTCWKMHFLALLTRHLENYWTEYQQSFDVDKFLDKNDSINVQGQKVNGQAHSMTKGPAGEGMEHLDVSCINFVILICHQFCVKFERSSFKGCRNN